jgi:hypothetical protein
MRPLDDNNAGARPIARGIGRTASRSRFRENSKTLSFPWWLRCYSGPAVANARQRGRSVYHVSLLFEPSIVGLIGPMSITLWEWDMHAVMKGAAFGRQQHQSRCTLCHMGARLVYARTCVSGECHQRRTNYHSRKYRLRHDRTSFAVQRRISGAPPAVVLGV